MQGAEWVNHVVSAQQIFKNKLKLLKIQLTFVWKVKVRIKLLALPCPTLFSSPGNNQMQKQLFADMGRKYTYDKNIFLQTTPRY